MGWLTIQVYVCPLWKFTLYMKLQYSIAGKGGQVGVMHFIITFRQLLH